MLLKNKVQNMSDFGPKKYKNADFDWKLFFLFQKLNQNMRSRTHISYHFIP